MSGKTRPVHVAVGVAILAYVATSGSAAFFPFEFGQDQLRRFFFPQAVPIDWMTTLGSPAYWFLFLLTLVILPVTAIATERAVSSTAIALPEEIPLWIPLALAGAMIAFCIFRLGQAGGLTASQAWDRSLCYDEKILRRVELFKLLGNQYYSFVYSSLPIIGCYLLARGLLRRQVVCIVASGIVGLITIWLGIATMQKLPSIVYVLVIGLTLALCGFGWIRSATVTAGAAAALYLALALTQFCTAQPKAWEIRAPLAPEAVEQKADRLPSLPGLREPSAGVSTVLPRPAPSAAAAVPAGEEGNGRLDQGIRILRAIGFRMAVGFPYYVQVFSDPRERCGIVLPSFGSLFEPQPCYPATKVFSVIYPSITYTLGSQPAGVSLSGYAEGGPLYAILATAIGGVLIGFISAHAKGRDPLSISLQVASCLYAYFLTQVPLIASLVDSYGLVWLLFPLFAMSAIVWMVRLISPGSRENPVQSEVLSPDSQP